MRGRSWAGAGGFPSTQVTPTPRPVSCPGRWRSGVDAVQCPVAVSELQSSARDSAGVSLRASAPGPLTLSLWSGGPDLGLACLLSPCVPRLHRVVTVVRVPGLLGSLSRVTMSFLGRGCRASGPGRKSSHPFLTCTLEAAPRACGSLGAGGVLGKPWF